jgi:hypothetical protein
MAHREPLSRNTQNGSYLDAGWRGWTAMQETEPTSELGHADDREAAGASIQGAPHDFLNLGNPISAKDDARERVIRFIDGVLLD